MNDSRKKCAVGMLTCFYASLELWKLLNYYGAHWKEICLKLFVGERVNWKLEMSSNRMFLGETSYDTFDCTHGIQGRSFLLARFTNPKTEEDLHKSRILNNSHTIALKPTLIKHIFEQFVSKHYNLLSKLKIRCSVSFTVQKRAD